MKKTILNFPELNFCDIVCKIKDFITKNQCRELSADISLLNLVDASKAALLCSTYHFAKYPDGKIYWEVADEQTRHIINSVKLKNMQLVVKDKNSKKKEAPTAV